MIQLSGVTKEFSSEHGKVLALDDVSLEIKRNEKFGIIGESGSGKSTLLRLINGLETVDTGTVTVANKDVTALKGKAMREFRKNISMIFQQFNLLNNITVEENILLPLKLHRYESPLDIEEVLSFTGLSQKRQSYPRELSGGQKQRVGIARALITNPDILLCDEPTSALDERTTDEIVEVLKNAHEVYGMTIVIVTHELEVIKKLADRTLVLEAGKVMNTIKVKKQESVVSKLSYYDRIKEVFET
ncbi:methionine ABC transporter ATP-binding protein [Jeotgalicoccus meleagridis]|uniref:Methionine import ATP-binding protein MetN 2 n=1 Tax=Jeotgalicoccus meleagridis TaxID=2759181 RepID=A0A6V7RCY9_9STAP|nr:ATP-binding cassette domain-containing protein [Jeotgalicoccus meleagridis]CAD2075523.1 Methionine import ATP-binding protein MetN 2 [Jeotgalicoccus meleagridis]